MPDKFGNRTPEEQQKINEQFKTFRPPVQEAPAQEVEVEKKEEKKTQPVPKKEDVED